METDRRDEYEEKLEKEIQELKNLGSDKSNVRKECLALQEKVNKMIQEKKVMTMEKIKREKDHLNLKIKIEQELRNNIQ